MLTSKRTLDLRGQRFGKLTVRSFSHNDEKSHKAVWLCECDCGNEKHIRSDMLLSRRAKACGCLRGQNSRLWHKIDRTGLKFGLLTVREFSHSEDKNSYWLCDCACGATKTVKWRYLSEGKVTSCGCKQKLKVSVPRIEVEDDQPPPRQRTPIHAIFYNPADRRAGR